MRVDRYRSADKTQWDAFVGASKNGTFILLRDYLEYHADRHRDHSLIVRDDAGRPLALLPATEADGGLVSHAGITYGGVVSSESMTVLRMLALFGALVAYMKDHGLTHLRYKAIPHIYHAVPADEDRYALFAHGAVLCRRDVLSVVANDRRTPFGRQRTRQLAKARSAALKVVTSTDFPAFWHLLEDNLRSAHGATPVHSLAEIDLLRRRFPDNIRLHLCLDASVPVAGVVIYDTPRVARAQYIGSTARGRATGALDLLFSELLGTYYAGHRYFDFGSSHRPDAALNEGLVRQKEGFGARTIVQDFYDMAIR